LLGSPAPSQKASAFSRLLIGQHSLPISKAAPRLCEAFCEVAALQLPLHRPFAQLAGWLRRSAKG